MSMNSKLSDAGALATSALAILRVIDSLRRLPTSTAIFFAAMMTPPERLSEVQCSGFRKIGAYRWHPGVISRLSDLESEVQNLAACQARERAAGQRGTVRCLERVAQGDSRDGRYQKPQPAEQHHPDAGQTQAEALGGAAIGELDDADSDAENQPDYPECQMGSDCAHCHILLKFDGAG